MNCPNDNEQLKTAFFHNVEVNYCSECLGVWFDKDELDLAKDDKDKDLNWMDIDLWRDKSKFHVSNGNKHCPVCRVGLREVKYDNSLGRPGEAKTKVDFCKKCQGVWLDRGEFKQLINYLKNKSDYEILHHYTKNLVLQLWEVFGGPKKFREELPEFLMLLKLFNYKFETQYPLLNGLIDELPK